LSEASLCFLAPVDKINLELLGEVKAFQQYILFVI